MPIFFDWMYVYPHVYIYPKLLIDPCNFPFISFIYVTDINSLDLGFQSTCWDILSISGHQMDSDYPNPKA